MFAFGVKEFKKLKKYKMGYTNFTVEKLEDIIEVHKPKSILDLGAQNMYNQAEVPAPYAKEWYESKGNIYCSFIKNQPEFITLEQFKTLDFKLS
jgi:hypothetical protein